MIGIAIDDRTSQAFPWQGPYEDNLIESNLIAGKGANTLAVGILVEGASRNLVTDNHILDCVTGIKLSESQVSPVSEVCKDNVVCFNVLNGCLTGISGSGSANLICNNKVMEATTIISPGSNPHYNNGLLTNFGIGTPKIEIGLDTNLYCSAANLLKTDNQFQAVDGLVTMTKAGTISDADFAALPPDGTVAVDMSDSRLYIRIAGTWKSVGLT